MPFYLKHRARRLMRSFGVDCRPFPAPGSLEYHIRRWPIDVLLDVGANTGQTALLWRRNGFRGRIISFEPVKSTFKVLEQMAAHDSLWDTHRLALGSEPGEAQMQVSQLSTYSSILAPTPALRELRADAATVSTESVPVQRLDSFLSDSDLGDQKIWLKVDTQGFELPVLTGASGIWDRIVVAQVEMATRPSYEGQRGLEDVIGFMRERGFFLADMIPGFADNGLLLEVDGIFLAQPDQQGSSS